MKNIIYNLGIDLTLDIIEGKWKTSLICWIGLKDRRNGELLNLMPGISQKVLTQQLRELENDRIIQRTSYGTVPPKVVYSLTEDGMELRQILVDLSIWGEKKAEHLNEDGNHIHITHDSSEIIPEENPTLKLLEQ
ncbi:winged helix-turn-helix transcriptional regulator [Companilactobacillus baiquanensis]|uniref:Winged helix-turn-helix transcriptional regulator n=1 Tax=Companilactobacillus baiquanensis TaxID=2486005 RepID=A0ABW1UUW6_9LACO|nr:helix-turn-helix domain-containing protein [Companilactobacillus baiquanensis]